MEKGGKRQEERDGEGEEGGMEASDKGGRYEDEGRRDGEDAIADERMFILCDILQRLSGLCPCFGSANVRQSCHWSQLQLEAVCEEQAVQPLCNQRLHAVWSRAGSTEGPSGPERFPLQTVYPAGESARFASKSRTGC